MKINTLILAITFGICAVATSAQTLSKKSITLEGARTVISGAKAFAKAANAPGGVIAVVDDGGNLVALERLDGTFTAGANISVGKAKTAVMFKRPTKFFEDIIKNGRTSMVALPDFTPLQGGVPITVDGQIIGGVGVSGAASAQQDEELAMAGAAMLSGEKASSVTFLDSKTVNDAFAKGAVLSGGTNGENYMVHASRREKAGLAEVHDLDTDIIYVLDGTATVVTGGSSVDPKTIEAGEHRGTSIEGGETRQLKKGDVLIVPKGTPHWFRQVDGTFLYYVVKVR
ncbi:MAG TPA: heme-binding protein [Pyrinomonadaceae bacterium]|nr:heme-binding protein [Chloracidobacterium sp.]HRJ90246.1 heme-binding protein [Pyrinomonadaceae bacterium]HRK49326.1 heme-binding protein [Pyrinomonadaceae bacterium]